MCSLNAWIRTPLLCVVLVVMVTHMCAGQGCPDRCLCFRSTVRCMFLQLDTIPQVAVDTTILDLRFNRIREIPTNSLRQLTQLNTLLLNNNHIKRIEDGVFSDLQELRYLYLYKNHITSIAPNAFHGLPKLEQLYIHYNELEELPPNLFQNLPSLDRLFLHNNRITRLPHRVFSSLSALRRLRLDSNALICDCEMMWLSQMLQTNEGFTEVQVTCQYPTDMAGKDLASVTMEELKCRKPEFTSEPSDLEVEFGGTAVFHCSAEGDPRPEIIWIHNKRKIESNLVDSSSRYNVLDDGTLRIQDISSGDQGVFECMARNAMGETMSRPAQLVTETSENAPPQIVVRPDSFEELEGETISLECRATGRPQPIITWTKNDLPLPRDPRFNALTRGSLIITSLKVDDRGLYRCIASNTAGRAEETARVEVLVPPSFVHTPRETTVVEGQSAYLTCAATGNPSPQITWTKDGSPLSLQDPRFTVSADGGTIWIRPTFVTDSGVYQCLASNEASVRGSSAKLVVKQELPPVLHSRPQNAEAFQGATVRFQCSVSADPPPSITWFRNGAALATSRKYEIQTNEESLVIRDVQGRDQGTYECVAENAAGVVRASATLTVFDSSFNPIHPSITNTVIDETVRQVQQEVNRAFNSTLTELRDPSKPRTPSDLLSLFRLPLGEALEITRSAEVFERTLEALHNQVQQGSSYNISHAEVEYEDLLTPFQLAIVANLSNCATHRRVVDCTDMCFHHRYRTFDGSCNNLRHPMWGSSLTPLNRLLPPVYENGFNTPRGWEPARLYNGHRLPSARHVSLELASAEHVTEDEVFTHMLMQWGQFIDHDLDFVPQAVSNARFSDGRHCNETCENHAPCFPIPVPVNDPRIRRHRCLGVTRSSAMCGSGMTSVFFQKVAQREQMNQITAYMDASNIYGSSEEQGFGLRDVNSNTGYLRTGYVMQTGKPLLPENRGEPVDCQMDPNKAHIPCFQAGDQRANEQLGLLSMHTLWMREHNRVASELRRNNPHWDGHMLYHEARKIVGAQLQHITYTHWLPNILGPKGMEMLGKYDGYNPATDATIINSFATAAFRFGHSLINPIIFRYDRNFKAIREGHLPLHQAFFTPYRIAEEGGIDPVLRGLFHASAKKLEPNEFLNTELTERLFKLAHEVALDLAALNIQRGRDHALSPYNAMRKHCGLKHAQTFYDLRGEITDRNVLYKLEEVYGHVDNIDLWVGGLAETVVDGAKIGPTLLCIIVEQFRRTRDGDRFWYENPGVFSPAQLSEMRQANLGRVLCDNGDNVTEVPRNVFIKEEYPGIGYLKCNSHEIPHIDLKIWASCCQDCSRSGNFYSLTSHFRGRRSIPDVSYRDQYLDEEIILTDDTPHSRKRRQAYQYNPIPPEPSIPNHLAFHSENRRFDVRGNDTTVSRSVNAQSVNSVHDHSHGHHQHDVHSGEADVSELVHMSHSMMDAVDVRIEGMEEAMHRLQKTIKRLSRKIKQLEHDQDHYAPPGAQNVTKTCYDDNGVLRLHNERWKEHDCRSCECVSGRLECVTETCQIPTCAYPTKVQGQCCPYCPQP